MLLCIWFDLFLDIIYVLSVVNIGATALVTEAATAIFGEAGVSAATGVMTVCLLNACLENDLKIVSIAR